LQEFKRLLETDDTVGLNEYITKANHIRKVLK
jgi:hypothetical protein